MPRRGGHGAALSERRAALLRGSPEQGGFTRAPFKPAMAPASLVAWRCESLKYAEETREKSAPTTTKRSREMLGGPRRTQEARAPGTVMTASFTGLPRYVDAMSFILPSTCAAKSNTSARTKTRCVVSARQTAAPHHRGDLLGGKLGRLALVGDDDVRLAGRVAAREADRGGRLQRW